ncbi:MAG: CbiX/SirB N-terminal domain-containing protein [Pirellulales bacterium]|nr:CbiX/SirB N-terminal domain-containing protein [Pirellulales bacterium]
MSNINRPLETKAIKLGTPDNRRSASDILDSAIHRDSSCGQQWSARAIVHNSNSNWTICTIGFWSAIVVFMGLVFGCQRVDPMAATEKGQRHVDSNPGESTAVLIVCHGSHSPQWRKSLLAVEENVRGNILNYNHIGALRLAFMEYSEPSIATCLRQFDELGYSKVLIVPLLLTVSSHSFDDIPSIAGLKEDRATAEKLKLEGIEIYQAKAQVDIAPLLDFTDILEKNVIRRVKAMSENPSDEGVVLVAYGDEQYDEEWTHLLEHIGGTLQKKLQIDTCRFAWCGHIARYKSEPTEVAIKQVLEKKKNVILIPVLVAVDEAFQGRIIGGAIKNVDAGERVRYRHDAILPDDNVEQWIIDTCQGDERSDDVSISGK